MIVVEFVNHDTSVGGLSSMGSIDPDGFVVRGGSGRGIRRCRLRQSRSADPSNSTINLLCPEVGTMSEVEVLKVGLVVLEIQMQKSDN